MSYRSLLVVGLARLLIRELADTNTIMLRYRRRLVTSPGQHEPDLRERDTEPFKQALQRTHLDQ